MRLLNPLRSLYHLGTGHAFQTPATSKDRMQELLHTLRPVEAPMGLRRLGQQTDGGYLVPDDLETLRGCYSPGVSASSDFEVECAELGMDVYLADRTVDGPASHHQRFHFTKKHLGAYNNAFSMTFDHWVDATRPNQEDDLMLQMDIEGCEYEVILNMSHRHIKQMRIMVIEFHHLDQLWCEPFFNIAKEVFAKILDTHKCVHIHPNNFVPCTSRQGIEIPPLMEFTFLRQDRLQGDEIQCSRYPHPLDKDNTSKPSIILPSCWHEGHAN